MIFKVVARAEWEAADGEYRGSPHDTADGFLHFSTASQLPQTLRLHYAGQNELMLLAVETMILGDALKWEYAPSRGEDFPHLYGALPRTAVLWARPIRRDADGAFLLDMGQPPL